MEKKRFKMYKKGKTWVIAPIVFFGLLAASDMVSADEVTQEQSIQMVDQRSNDTVQINEATQNQNQQEETALGSEETVEGNNSSENELDETVDTEETTSIEADTSVNADQDETEVKSNAEIESSNDSDNTQNEEIEKNDEKTASSNNEGLEEKDKTDASDADENWVVQATEPKEDVKQSETPANVVAVPVVKQENKVNTKETTSPSVVKVKAVATSTPASSRVSSQPIISIYRVYNPNSGEHLHTRDLNEKNYLVKVGWRYEGISMKVTTSGRQLFRLYNPNSGEHFYTLAGNERDNLKRSGWRYEGIAWLTPWSGLPMYRVFNPNSKGAGSHHYTMSLGERNSLVKEGWKNEGISWYSLAEASPLDLNFLGITRNHIVNELNKHTKDNYYLGTPYKGLSSNDASQFMKPGSSFNCTGFVAKAIQNAGGAISAITNLSNNWGGAANAYNWRNALNVKVTKYVYNSVADVLKSGKAQKGDILYFEPDYKKVNYDCHIGFFWGNSASENKFWHSVPKKNNISTIYAPSGYSKVYLYKM